MNGCASPASGSSGVRAGIKARGLDLALIVSDAPAAVAGVFTRSSVVGAPVELCRRRVRSGFSRGVVVNSGCSNVAMGERGRRDAAEMARLAALAVGAAPAEMLVASTGVIGQPLPMARIRRGIAAAAAGLSESGLARPPRRSAPPTPSRSSRHATLSARRPPRHDRRDRQGLGDDRAEHGHPARPSCSPTRPRARFSCAAPCGALPTRASTA